MDDCTSPKVNKTKNKKNIDCAGTNVHNEHIAND